MTEQFFDKELAAREAPGIPGMLEFDIPVRGDNRGWFKENFQKEKMLPLGFPESFLQKENCKIMSAFLVKMCYVVYMLSHGTSTSLLQMMVRF